MVHHLFMSLATVIRFIRRVIFRFLLVIVLVGLNVATLVSDTVYDGLNRLVWGAVELVSEQAADRRPRTRAEIDADLTRSRTELQATEARVLATRDELQEVRASKRALETEVASQRERLTIAEANARHLEAELDEVMNRNSNLSAELKANKVRIDSMAAEIDLSKKNRSEAVQTAAALRSRIVHSIRRDASAEAFEAVPFIGTAVFLGTLAYELNDSCHQLRELEALDAILRGRRPELIDEAMCLLSYEDMVAAVTGQDRGYARCVSDRLATKELNPLSCSGYEPAVPQITDSPIRPQNQPTEQFRID